MFNFKNFWFSNICKIPGCCSGIRGFIFADVVASSVKEGLRAAPQKSLSDFARPCRVARRMKFGCGAPAHLLAQTPSSTRNVLLHLRRRLLSGNSEPHREPFIFMKCLMRYITTPTGIAHITI